MKIVIAQQNGHHFSEPSERYKERRHRCDCSYFLQQSLKSQVAKVFRTCGEGNMVLRYARC